MRKFILSFFALTLSVGLWAIDGVKYIDAYGQEKTANNVTEITNSDAILKSGWYVVKGADVQTGTLISLGNVHLILADGAKLTATGKESGSAGIDVSGSSISLTIYGQSSQTGQLEAIGGDFSAGMGGEKNISISTNITINGGKITAIGGKGAAGIGGGSGGSGSDITINNGIVTAIGGDGASGIGNGSGGNSASNITVNASILITVGIPPMEVIAKTRTNTTDIASYLAGHRYVTIEGRNHGGGTKDSPYLIYNYNDLLQFSNEVYAGNFGLCARLEADIDAAGKTDWQPIGAANKYYVGTFNGNGHVIKNLSINGGNNKNDIGLFGKIGTGAEVYGLGIVDGHFEGNYYVGAICGDFGAGVIHDCYVFNTYVKGYETSAGGMVGSHYYNAVLRDCYIYPQAQHDVQYAGVINGTAYGNSYNCYYISDKDMDSYIYRELRYTNAIFDIKRVSVADAKSGVMCNKLNHYGSNGKHWYQTLGSDESPVVDFTHGIVEWDGEKFINRSRENVEITYFTSDNNPVTLRGSFGTSKLIGNYVTSENGIKKCIIVCDQPITMIDAYTFAQDSTLTAIALPGSLYRISDNAFASCAHLEEIVLGENIESIGNEAFMGCDALKNVYIYAVQPPQCGSDAFAFGAGATIHVTDEYLYKWAEGWKNLKIVGDVDMMNEFKAKKKNELLLATGVSAESDIPTEVRDKYNEYASSIEKATSVATIDAVCVKGVGELQKMVQLLRWKDNGENMTNY